MGNKNMYDQSLSRQDALPEQKEAFYLQSLNPAQRESVLCLDKPLLVLAGAGTGKTKVLTSRIAHIIHTGQAKPWEILAVTFTNKAAKEMQERVAHLLGEQYGLSWTGTFHSIAAKILRSHAQIVGLNSQFTILNDDDQERLLKQILESAREDIKRTPPKVLAYVIDKWKNKGLLPNQIQLMDMPDIYGGRAAEYYQIYQDRLKQLNCVDFGDLLLHNITIFKNNPAVLSDYHRRFKFILVDEYQDTNIAQYLWLRLLAQGNSNLCCVGDDDQSIYGWRGAEVGNILKFERDFEGAKITRLEENYRSTPTILKAASSVIAHNHGRLGKTLYSQNPDGDKIFLKTTWNGEEEADYISRKIETIARNKEISFSEMAILVRTSSQMRILEEKLILGTIPYRVVGGMKFYERLEVRDALSYLRLVAQPHDSLAFERIINKPKRGIGDAAVASIRSIANENDVSSYMALQKMLAMKAFKPKQQAVLQEFMDNLHHWMELSKGHSVDELTQIILDESGYMQMLLDDKTPESVGRIENLKELVKSTGGYESLGHFLEHIALVMDNNALDTQEKVTLMTLHAAKGLEFHTVFLPGWEDGLFPSQKSIDENGLAGVEEERRLAYVALTRAKHRIFLSFAQNRRLYNQWQSTVPSRFISEIPDECLGSDNGNYFSMTQMNQAVPFESGSHSYDTSVKLHNQRFIDHEATGDMKKGDKVYHEKFGDGIVINVDSGRALVKFTDSGFKNVMMRYLKNL